jgi:septal ring factor EnvC (AmiA/AmiB activator)
MSRHRPPHSRLLALLGALGATVALAGAGAAAPDRATAAPGLGRLNSQLGATQARSQTLASSLAALGSEIASLNRQIALIQSREAAVRVQLAQDQSRLAAARVAVARERAVVVALRDRLARARLILARQLVSSYESSRPDLMSVVLEAHGFTQLLDQLQFITSAETQQQQIITITRVAKAHADAAQRRLTRLESADQRATEATALQARALAGMNAVLSSRQAALGHAQAQQAAAAAAAAALRAAPAYSSGPAVSTSGWAIPYPIVLCESGGQNLPPNSAGASGYYQIIPNTWRLFGGSGPAAYLAPKGEQDAVAARIWNGGAGAGNWVCAGIVGIH